MYSQVNRKYVFFLKTFLVVNSLTLNLKYSHTTIASSHSPHSCFHFEICALTKVTYSVLSKSETLKRQRDGPENVCSGDKTSNLIAE